MTFQDCSGAELSRAPRTQARTERPRAQQRRWRALTWTALAGAGVAACSDAGAGADAAPSARATASGGSTSTGAREPGAVLPPLGGSTSQTTESTSQLDGTGLITDEPPELATTIFPESPSCEGSEPTACKGESCCKREPVLTDDELMTVAPNVSVLLSGYALDKFEVTVGRFRTFLDAYDDWRATYNPESGSGAHPFTPGSGWDRNPTWEVALADSAALMRVSLKCNANQQTWTDVKGFNENKPINCVSWYEAFAFCVWDDGRLPTEAEWQYAAVGGAQARTFAWGNTPLMPMLASYACNAAGTTSSCTADDIPDVGTYPSGNGRFHQADLTGSVYEWALDWYAEYPEVMRDDYAKTDTGTQRMLRGGAWNSTRLNAMASTDRSFRAEPIFRSPITGIRCARVVAAEVY